MPIEQHRGELTGERDSRSPAEPGTGRTGWPSATVDAAIAGALTVFAVVAVLVGFESRSDGTTGALSWIAVGASGVALLARRRRPVPSLLMILAGWVAVAADSGVEVALAPAVFVALYTVARAGLRGTPLIVSIAAALAAAAVIAWLENTPFVGEFLGETTQVLLALALGELVRLRAVRLERRIEAESAARIQAERLRIARDMHDIVAHGLSVIAVQSGVASHLLEKEGSTVSDIRVTLDTINQTGKETLEELRAMVGVLRSSNEDVPLRPAPTDPNDFSELLDAAERTGLELKFELSGSFPPSVSDSCVIALHRITQEALTNSARHSVQALVSVSIKHGTEAVRCVITNPVGEAPPTEVSGNGVGIVGMTERAESLGGSLHAERTVDGSFRVDATIPYHPRP